MKNVKKMVLLVMFMSLFAPQSQAYNQTDTYLGEIRMFAGSYAPVGWAFCNGQTLPISQNTALFSILGTTYGGDGRTTFKLPDLRGRAPVHDGGGYNRNLEQFSLGQDLQYSPIRVKTADDDNDPIIVRTPNLRINFIIAIEGLYPSRG